MFFDLQAHIQTLRGRILETILSLRFLIFQYGIVYKLHLTGKNTSFAVSFLSALLRVLSCPAKFVISAPTLFYSVRTSHV